MGNAYTRYGLSNFYSRYVSSGFYGSSQFTVAVGHIALSSLYPTVCWVHIHLVPDPYKQVSFLSEYRLHFFNISWKYMHLVNHTDSDWVPVFHQGRVNQPLAQQQTKHLHSLDICHAYASVQNRLRSFFLGDFFHSTSAGGRCNYCLISHFFRTMH